MIFEEIKNIIITQLAKYSFVEIEERHISLQTKLIKDLSADYLDVRNILKEIKEKYNINLKFNKETTDISVENLVKMIELELAQVH